MYNTETLHMQYLIKVIALFLSPEQVVLYNTFSIVVTGVYSHYGRGTRF